MYTMPTSWYGFGISLAKYSISANPWGNTYNDKGAYYFVAIKSISGYIIQTVALPANTHFAIQFDFAQRPDTFNHYKPPTVAVYCNAPGNTGNITKINIKLNFIIIFYFYSCLFCNANFY